MFDILWICLTYCIGSVPFGLVFAKTFCRIDPRTAGSGNVGATNVARLCGKAWGAATLACDLLKGTIPVFIAMQYSTSELVWTLTALAAILGHLYSCFLGFKGGKAVATSIGVLIPLAFWQLLIAVCICLFLIWRSGFVSLGSLALVTAMPILLALLIGASLSASGALLQSVMRNPLADPGTIGVSAGAGTAATTILLIFPHLTNSVPIFAFAGAALACVLIYSLAWKGGVDPVRIILSGVAITGDESLARCADVLLSTGLHRVFISLGGDGVYAADYQGGRIKVPCGTAKMVNTTGCGDAFMAALAWGWLEGLGLREAALAGEAASAIAMEGAETINPAMSAEKLQERMGRGA